MPRITPEKSSFAQTCNLLSHYIKQKCTLRDLNLDINGEAADSSSSSGKTAEQASTTQKPMNLFSQHATVQDDATMQDDATSSSEEAESEAKSGQMSIFYLDDICDGKAKQVMQLTSKSISVTPVNTSCSGYVKPSSSKLDVHDHSMCCVGGGIKQQQQWQPIASSDLPLARRASLHRFLSKRKDRASARGPYHIHNPSS